MNWFRHGSETVAGEAARPRRSVWDWLRAARPALAIVFALSFLLTIYAPLELYFTNTEEFHFDFFLLMPQLARLFLCFMAAGLIGMALCRLVYVRLYDAAMAAALVALVCTYIQGMYLAGNLPPLDGTAINWGDYDTDRLISVLLWLIVGGVTALLGRFLHRKRFYTLVTGCSLFLSAVLLVTVVTVGIQYDGFSRKQNIAVTKDSEFTMSTDQNLVLFIIDAADSETFNQMLSSSNPEFADILSDFTYYPNTVSAYTFTKHSIPYILTGKWYENKGDFREFTTQAMDESPLLTTLREQNYQMGIYEEELLYENDNVYALDNVSKVTYHFNSFRELAVNELKLVWFKYAPYPLKELVTVNMDAFNHLLSTDENALLFHASNQDFYQDVGRSRITTTEDKCFRFIHIEGAHLPYRYNKDVEIIDTSEGSYPQNMECSMTVLSRYLTALKDAGVYDNTAIVVMADHGYGYLHDFALEARCNPLLAVKGIGEHHELEISQAPISYEDLQTCYQRLLSGAQSGEVFDAKEGDERPRRALLYVYEEDDHMMEYYQYGNAADISTLKPTGTVYDLEE